MAKNSDGTVVVRTPGKLASTPSVAGQTGITKPVTAKSTTSGPKVVGIKRTPVPRSALGH